MTYPDKIPYMREMAECYEIGPVVEHVLGLPDFAVWSGSVTEGKHHYGKGGLQFHTYEVLTQCLLAYVRFHGLYPLDRHVLFLAALFHDVGKLWDYQPNKAQADILNEDPYSGTWVPTLHKRQIHHISRSALVWDGAAKACGLGQALTDNVTHCILSHHGCREWGSPTSPHSREAHILHLMDALSARLNDADTFDPIKNAV
jgi:3'-5' exoribonuclease